MEPIEPFFDVVDNVRVGYGIKFGCLIVAGEACLDRIPVVNEVDDASELMRVAAIETTERLYGGDASEHLVDIHCAELWLVKSGLVFIGANDNALVAFVEFLRRVAFADAVEARFGDFFLADL